MSSLDTQFVRADFKKLTSAKRHSFPKSGSPKDVPHGQGVYIIYSPHRHKVVHVGRTYRGTAGLRQRLNNHLHSASSFTVEYLKGHGKKLRNGYTFRYLELKPWRRRALLEAYATGCLCPAHLGKYRRRTKKT